MTEYAYDVTIRAVVRVKANNEEEGSERVEKIIETTTPEEVVDTFGEHGVKITEMSTAARPRLFEINGDPYEPEPDTDEDFIRRAEDGGATFEKTKDGLWHAQGLTGLWVVSDPQPTLAACAKLYCKEMDL